MSPDAAAWVSQIPWGPVAVIAIFLVGWFFVQSGAKKKQGLLREKIQAGALVIDVRSPGEFQSGHFPGAVNHPVEQIEASIKKLGAKDRALIVHCASGARSARAAQVLRNAGFSDVTDAGGIGNLPR